MMMMEIMQNRIASQVDNQIQENADNLESDVKAKTLAIQSLKKLQKSGRKQLSQDNQELIYGSDVSYNWRQDKTF